MARERKSAGRGQTIILNGYIVRIRKGRCDFEIQRAKHLPPPVVRGKRRNDKRTG